MSPASSRLPRSGKRDRRVFPFSRRHQASLQHIRERRLAWRFYDKAPRARFDLGCEHDNYFGRYRVYEAEDGDLDFYLILGPRLRDVTAKFVALTGRTALPPRWSLGFAQTAMALADAPDAQARIQGVIDAAKAFDVPISSFHFGSGYTSIGKKR